MTLPLGSTLAFSRQQDLCSRSVQNMVCVLCATASFEDSIGLSGQTSKRGGLKVLCHTGSCDEFWCTRSILKPSELAHFVLPSSMAARDRRQEGSEADDSGDHSVIFYASALFLLSTLQRQLFYGFGVKKKHLLSTLRKKSLFVT